MTFKQSLTIFISIVNKALEPEKSRLNSEAESENENILGYRDGNLMWHEHGMTEHETDLGMTCEPAFETEDEDVGQLTDDLDMGGEGSNPGELEKAIVNATAQNSKDIERVLTDDARCHRASSDDSVSSLLNDGIIKFTWNEQNEPVEHIHASVENSVMGLLVMMESSNIKDPISTSSTIVDISTLQPLDGLCGSEQGATSLIS